MYLFEGYFKFLNPVYYPLYSNVPHMSLSALWTPGGGAPVCRSAP